jgi:hypothetical protein
LRPPPARRRDGHRGRGEGRASEIDFGMISTGWCALINEYVGSMSARLGRLDAARLQH